MSNFRNINQEGLDLIKRFEGFSSAPYKCPAGKLTIGFGHLILPSEKFSSITREQAEDLLVKDLSTPITKINELVKIDINYNQFSALCSFVFNLGVGSLSSSTLLKVVNAGKHLDVPNELIKWKMAAGAPLKGLLLRRLAEASLYLS